MQHCQKSHSRGEVDLGICGLTFGGMLISKKYFENARALNARGTEKRLLEFSNGDKILV